MSYEVTPGDIAQPFDLSTIDQHSVESATWAYVSECARIAALPDYSDAYNNQRDAVEATFKEYVLAESDDPISIAESTPYGERVAFYLESKAYNVASVIEEDQPTDKDRQFLARYLGLALETSLVELYETWERRVEYDGILEGCAYHNKSIAENRAFTEKLYRKQTQ